MVERCIPLRFSSITMEDPSFELEPLCLFSESAVWQLNRDYYQKEGIRAWQNDVVPHHMTSNSLVGKTYAEIIFGLLRDLSFKHKTTETVYILELGAGHGRLAYHILRHLEQLTADLNITLPPYCYIISDIVEESFSFFLEHPQLKPFFEKSKLDVCYFDATQTDTLELLHSKQTFAKRDLAQPLVLVANYFFDSLPTDLFYVKDKKLSSCLAALHADKDPAGFTEVELIEHMEINFFKERVSEPFYEDPIYNEILEEYRNKIFDSYLFFPITGFQCLRRLEVLSKEGIMLLSMDKGFHSLDAIDRKSAPELILHGSFSIWVNYHAFGQYCQKRNGKSFLPVQESFYSPVVCLLLLNDAGDFKESAVSYAQYVTRFGPDEFNAIKRHIYKQVATLDMKELLALIRLSCFDATFTINLLPRIKRMAMHISIVERAKLKEALDEVWAMYFSINEPFDLAYEIGGLFYDLGYYKEALIYYAYSNLAYDDTADTMYNQALCHYQLKEDVAFERVKEAGKLEFPDNVKLRELDGLDMG